MRYLVILGGQIYETALLKKLLSELDFDRVIAADSGLNWAYRLGILPDQMLGDFDSAEPEVVEYYREK
ncbi:MAG: thiamine diphosphokinase, partial [Firmicutes bacterium]|nr:thiamine diphosphokinase [Bacillota bacterium]